MGIVRAVLQKPKIPYVCARNFAIRLQIPNLRGFAIADCIINRNELLTRIEFCKFFYAPQMHLAAHRFVYRKLSNYFQMIAKKLHFVVFHIII